jgi:signal recognition particle receptor subunit beta
MPLINHTIKEINAKLVYIGPASAGKTTNLNYIYSKLKEKSRGKFKSMNLQNDRMLFFDFLPSGQGNMDGYSIRFHIYTIPGEVSRLSSLKMMLKGVDGLVVVADSGSDKMAANSESLNNLGVCLAAYGKTLSDIPCVIECNKQDSPQALAPEGIGRALNLAHYPLMPAVATRGEGVLESVFALVKMVLKNIRNDGILLKGQPEQLHGITKSAGQEPLAAQPVAAAAIYNEPMTEPEAQLLPPDIPNEREADRVSAILAGEPVIEVAGGAELVEGGVMRLPLVISYGGQRKRMSLNISLSTNLD